MYTCCLSRFFSLVLGRLTLTLTLNPRLVRLVDGVKGEWARIGVGLYKIFVYFEAVVHESTILSPPPPTCIAHPGAILLHEYWTVYDLPSGPPFVCYTPYNICDNNIVQRPR